MANNHVTLPPSEDAPILHSTPQLEEMTMSSSSTLRSLDESRNLPVPEVHCPIVPINALLSTLFPFVAPTVVEEVERSLLTTGRLSERGWTAFQATCGKHGGIYEPRNSRSHKVDTFKALETVFSDILESAAPNTRPLVRLSMHGRRYFENSTPNSARPDGSIYLTTTSLPWPRKVDNLVLDYADIGFIIEVKKQSNAKNREGNARKILQAAQYKMRCDPRCLFVTGITVENTTACLWYFDRAVVMPSDDFDFMKDSRTLIRLFLGFILAKDEVTMGFDTSIRCIGPPENLSVGAKQERQYQIDVRSPPCSNPTSFRTNKRIDDGGTARICGRGTRVWEVTMNNDPDINRKYVLKDAWVDEGRVDEGAILKELHAPFDEVPVDGAAQPANDDQGGKSEKPRHFLTSKCHGSLFLTDAGGVEREDKTINLSIKLVFPVAIQLPSEDESNGVYNTCDNDPPGSPTRWGSRKHFRIVFEEPPGQPITKLETHVEAFEALRGGLKAMRDMLRKGFIHGDISAGNILLMDYGGVLIDLEFANRFPGNQSKHHAVRTGTKQFMAVEVVALKYLFEPIDTTKLTPATTGDRVDIPWFHNPLHDIESAWWIAIWIVFTFPGINLNDQEDIDPKDPWRNKRRELFHDANQLTRRDFFTLTNVHHRLPEDLPEMLRLHLENWRRDLFDAHTQVERDLPAGSHLAFDYDKAFVDAIGIVDKILRSLAATKRKH